MTKSFKVLPCIAILLSGFIVPVSVSSQNICGYFSRSMFYSGVYYKKTQFEKEQVPDYENSSFWRTYKAVDSRNIYQQDYEYKFAVENNVSEDYYQLTLSNYTCVITATTVIVDYYCRKNGYSLDTFEIYKNILWDSYYRGYYIHGTEDGSKASGVAFDDVCYVLYYGLSAYQSYTGKNFNYIEKCSTNIYQKVKDVVDAGDIALYIFSPSANAHAMVACGYVSLDVTMDTGTKREINAIVTNDVQNNYNPSLSFSSKWYNETDACDPSSNVANFSFIPSTDAISGGDYLWTIRSM